MLHFVTLAVALVLTAAAPQSNFIFKNDITPEEAQQYLNKPPFTEPQLSGRTAVLPLIRYNDPRFRTAEAGPTLGHYWKNGQEIENTDDYVEEVYNAAQYHGQDGLGAYAYGYQTPESSKAEDRQRSGLVSGSYLYKSPGNPDIIKVRYWADSQGFHQEDNIPKVELKPAEETPALREARLRFEKAWKEAASAKPPTVPPYPFNNQDPYQTQASENQAVVAPAPVPETQAREGKAYAYNPNQGSYQQAAYQGQGLNYQGQGQGLNYQGQGYQGEGYQGGEYQGNQGQYQGEKLKDEDEEPKGPPRGFFYSFEYPVSVIVPKNDPSYVKPGYPVDHDTVGISSQ